MDPVMIARIHLRQGTPGAVRARMLVKKALSMRVRPGSFYRFLLAERSLRRLAFNELSRMLYYQPLFEALCEEVGTGCRLEICPDSKLPVVDNCELSLGVGVRLSARSTFQGARNAPVQPRITIGDHSYLGHRIVLRAGLSITLGSHVTIASNVILSGDPGHPLDPIARRAQPAPRDSLRAILVGDDAWIAEGSTVLGGVNIGRGAVIGAHSVVTHDVPPFCVAAGNPAKVIQQLGPRGERLHPGSAASREHSQLHSSPVRG